MVKAKSFIEKFYVALLGFSCMRRYLCYLSAHLTILNQEPFGAASPCTGILIYFRMRKYFQP